MSSISLIVLFLNAWLVSANSDCQAVLKQHLQARTKEAVPYHPDNVLYFLHVPRTAGRTFHTCFLKPSTPQERRCPKAYDHLRIDAKVPNCHLLSSHDDFSVVDMLSDKVTVISQLRDPVDRFLSAYEFAIELAVREVKRKRAVKKVPGRVITEDVWPWKYFIPWFAADIRKRVSPQQHYAPPTGRAPHWPHMLLTEVAGAGCCAGSGASAKGRCVLRARSVTCWGDGADRCG
jgi:protein-tyrosine sulfotransferase